MEAASRETLRIVDANLNRAAEGLRVLEEFARLSLNEASLSRKLKEMRHALLAVPPEFQTALISARDAPGDVGRDLKAARQEQANSPAGAIMANARRVQESLRVLEELARTAALPLDTNGYRNTRFALYDIEKDLLDRRLRRDKLERLAGLHVIIDMTSLKGREAGELAGAAVGGGASVIRLRARGLDGGPFLAMAEKTKALCADRGVLFIVDDSLEVALAADAHGLHVERGGLPVSVARRLLLAGQLLGASAGTIDEARKAGADGADYLGAAPERLAEIKQAVDLPIVAIGGINRENIAKVMRKGAAAAAVTSAVTDAADVAAACRELVNIIKEVRLG